MNSKLAFLSSLAQVAAVVATGCAPSPGSASPEPAASVNAAPTEQTPLPSLEGVTSLQEGPALAARLEGRVAVLDLWATWCEPCRESIPKVVRLAQSYEGATDDPEVVVVGIHVGAGVETARRYADDAGISYPLFADPEFAFSDRVGSRSVPLLLVVDQQGRIVHRTPELDAETLAIVRQLLAQP